MKSRFLTAKDAKDANVKESAYDVIQASRHRALYSGDLCALGALGGE